MRAAPFLEAGGARDLTRLEPLGRGSNEVIDIDQTQITNFEAGGQLRMGRPRLPTERKDPAPALEYTRTRRLVRQQFSVPGLGRLSARACEGFGLG
jgi:hypothetical protein